MSYKYEHDISVLECRLDLGFLVLHLSVTGLVRCTISSQVLGLDFCI